MIPVEKVPPIENMKRQTRRPSITQMVDIIQLTTNSNNRVGGSGSVPYAEGLDYDKAGSENNDPNRLAPSILSPILRLSDALAIVVSGISIYLIYLYVRHPESVGPYIGTILTGGLFFAILLDYAGIYKQSELLEKRVSIRRVASVWAATFALLVVFAFVFKISDSFSRVWAVGWFFSALGFLAAGRMAIYYWIDVKAAQGCFASRTVIVGAGELGFRLADRLKDAEGIDLRIQGFVDDRSDRVPNQIGRHKLLGNIESLITMIQDGKVDQVFIALPWQAEERINEIVRLLALTPVHIRLAPDFAGISFLNKPFTTIARMPFLNIFDCPISGTSRMVKRAEDLVVASLLLVFLMPLMALIALIIKIDSPGPVFFKQTRRGFNCQKFRVWKFRTMYDHMKDPNADRITSMNDVRVTRFGRFLRRSSLDELPQLFNIIEGSMSLVGPRPHALAAKTENRLYHEAVDLYAARYRVRPGLTGWAQVNGWRGETDTAKKLEKRVEHDLYYIENWSLWLDLFIILKTFYVVLRAKNAY